MKELHIIQGDNREHRKVLRRFWSIRPRTCGGCGEVLGGTSRRRYCSAACNQRVLRAMRRGMAA